MISSTCKEIFSEAQVQKLLGIQEQPMYAHDMHGFPNKDEVR